MIYTLGQLTACVKEYCAKLMDLMSADQELQNGIDGLQAQIDDLNLGGAGYTLDLTMKTIYEEQVAGGALNVNGTQLWERNSTVTRLGEGRYRVVFNTVHPDGVEYHISVSGREDIVNRDNPKVTVVEGTKTASGFDIMVTVDDNGTGADIFEDNPWTFGVRWPCQVVENAVLIEVVEEPEPTIELGAPANGVLESDNFQDGNGNAPFNLQVRNTTNTDTTWQAVVVGPYATIPGLVPGPYTLTTVDNGDGTFTHSFVGTTLLGDFDNIVITGGLPVPAGAGGAANVDLYIP